MQPSTAKINRKLIQRMVTFAVIIVIVGLGAWWLLSKRGDPDLLYPPASTVGDIAAIQELNPEGAEAVIIKPDGTILPSPEYEKGKTDVNVTWRPDGGRLFFESDRYNNQPHLFRWNPDKGIVERRTTDKRTKGLMSFTVPGAETSGSHALMISGGTVLDTDADAGETKQILPPSSKNGGQTQPAGENGQQNQMTQVYAQYGSSFAKAVWTKNKQYVVAVLNRDTGDQALILQDISKPNVPPQPLAQAKHIGFDVNPVSGDIVFTVQGFELPDWWPDEARNHFIKNGKIVPPYKNAIGILDSTFQGLPTFLQAPNAIGFGDPVFAPDGNSLLLPVGTSEDDGLHVKSIDVLPIVHGENQKLQLGQPQHIAPGEFHHPNWSPDGSQIVALQKSASGTMDVVVVEKGSGRVNNLTNGKGNYSEAVFSPQLKEAGTS